MVGEVGLILQLCASLHVYQGSDHNSYDQSPDIHLV